MESCWCLGRLLVPWRGEAGGLPSLTTGSEPVLAARERAVHYPFLAPWHIPASLEALPELHRVLSLPLTTGTTPASPRVGSVLTWLQHEVLALRPALPREGCS